MAVAITKDQLLDYIGAGAESVSIVESLRASAFAQLRAATGTDWEKNASEIANEAVRVMVWLSFYALRGTDTTQHLENYKTQLIKQLQYAEVTQDANTEA